MAKLERTKSAENNLIRHEADHRHQIKEQDCFTRQRTPGSQWHREEESAHATME